MRRLIVLTAAVTICVALFACGRKGDRDEVTLTAGFDHEYVDRPEYQRFEEIYGFQFDNPQLLDPALAYRALEAKQVDVVDVFTTDGRIEAYDLRVLEDDRNLFPPYDACVLVRQKTLESHPGLRTTLEKLSGRISQEEMQRMNLKFSERAVPPGVVARDFLKKEGLLKDEKNGGGQKPPVVVGSKHFGEQKILGHMLAQMIESNTPYAGEKRLGLQGTKVCFGALRSGEIDVYIEYTGTGLANILNEKYDPSQSSAHILKHVRDEFDSRWDLAWLDPIGFNNTYAYAMREEQAEKLGIEKISDLEPYVDD
jgi:osmoprotectant transport system permease protein